MKLYVVTKNDETVAVMDNEVSGALHFSDDEFHRYLDNGASTFDLTVAKKHRIYSNATDIEMEDFQYLVANNFLIFTYKNKDYKFTIRRVEETETSIRLFCEDLSFDLLNEYRGPYIADKAYNIAKYVNDCLTDSGYTIGINEFAKNTRTLKWEGDDTVLKRLLSICNSFDAELEFETQLNNDRSVNKQLVHLRKRVGLNRPDIELKYGREVSSIRRNVDLTELITAIKPRGHENDGKYVTIKNIAKEVKDSDGNVAYFTKKGSEYLYAPMANQIFGSPEKKSGGYIVGQFSYDTESETELYNRALTELQLKCMPAYEYEIEGFYDVDVGDTVRAIDEAYNPILMLEARISEQIISFTDPTRNKTVYSNYRVLDNLVSQSLLDRIDDVKDYAEQVARTYIFSLKNVGSSMFKNGTGEVTYTVQAEKNNKDVTSEFDSFNWTKQLKDGTPDEAWNALHVDFGTVLTVTPDDFEDTATFSYVALKGEKTFGGASGVVTKVYDGEDGKTPIKGVDYFDGVDGADGKTAYIHIRYSQSADGSGMTENPAGAVYVGLQTSQNPTASTVPADYMWSKIKGQDGIAGETGADGRTSYLHIKYSDDGGMTFTATNGETAGAYMGQYVDFTQADSTDVTKYTWSKVKGEQGPKGDPGNQGIPGTPGADGRTPYFHTAYAWSADGTDRFTPGYPNENLIVRKTEINNTWINAAGNVEGNPDHATSQPFSVSVGDSYTFTKNNNSFPGIAYFRYRFLDANGAYLSRASNSQDLFTITVPNNAHFLQVSYPKDVTPKVELGKFATIYTPAPSEDYANAYPTYIGTYTDYASADSTNPATYTWSRLLGNEGADGISVTATEEEYYISTSGTSQSGGSWSTTVPNNADVSKFVWRRTKTTFSNGNITYTEPALIQGMTGIYPYIGPSQPANPKEGQQWWKSDASGNITDFLVYKSGSWQGQTIQQSILNIVSLNAVNITGSTITGTTINSSKFNTTFDFNPFPNGVKRKGTMQIANAETAINYTTYDSNSNVTLGTGNATYGGEGVMLNDVPAGDPEHAQYLALTPYGLTLNIGTIGGTLRYQDVIAKPKTGLTAATDWAVYTTDPANGSYPAAMRIGRTVQLVGAFKPTKTLPCTGNTEIYVMATLDPVFRPADNVSVVALGSGLRKYRLSVQADGKITASRNTDTNGYTDFSSGGWYAISVVYAAADMPE